MDWVEWLFMVAASLAIVPHLWTWLVSWSMDGVVAVSLTIAMMGAGVAVGHHVVRSIQWVLPVRLPRSAPPKHWAEIVRQNVPLTRELSDPSFERLLKVMQVFLRRKRFEGAGGLEVTDEMRVTIAAQACLLLLHLGIAAYPGLHTIIVYPDAFVPRRPGESKPDRTTATLGESWSTGTVVLSWDSVQHGAFNPRDGQNVVLHEFAHQLDQATGAADGTPIMLAPTSVPAWARVIGKRYAQLRRAKRLGRRTVLDHYGATNRAEFFAVATEAFLEKPRQLRKNKPDLFEALAAFYGWDPITELERRGSHGVST